MRFICTARLSFRCIASFLPKMQPHTHTYINQHQIEIFQRVATLAIFVLLFWFACDQWLVVHQSAMQRQWHWQWQTRRYSTNKQKKRAARYKTRRNLAKNRKRCARCCCCFVLMHSIGTNYVMIFVFRARQTINSDFIEQPT